MHNAFVGRFHTRKVKYERRVLLDFPEVIDGATTNPVDSSQVPNEHMGLVGPHELRNVVLPFILSVKYTAPDIKVSGDTVHYNGEGRGTKPEKARECREPVIGFFHEKHCGMAGLEREAYVAIAVLRSRTNEGNLSVLVQP
jgi:hypothetical protein